MSRENKPRRSAEEVMLRTSLVLRQIADRALSSVSLDVEALEQKITTPEGRTVHLFVGPEAMQRALAALGQYTAEQSMPLTSVLEDQRTSGWYFIT